MRLIPGKTKVKIELFKGISVADIVVGMITLGLSALVFLSTIPGRLYVAVGVLSVGVFLLLRLDQQPNYKLLLSLLRYLAFPKRFWRMFTDKHLLTANAEANKGEHWNEFFSDKYSPDEDYSLRESIEKIMSDKKQFKEEEERLNSKDISDEEKNAIWQSRKKQEDTKSKKKEEKKDASYKKEKDVEEVIAFTGIADGFIEYNGKYYGTVIEIDPVEFRFFSRYRREASIENCLGKIFRSLKIDYCANLVKIDRPVIYDSYLEKEYDKLDELRASYENGLLTEDELKSRVEIQYDRINAMRTICYDDKVVQPFYYLVFFNINKRQLEIDTQNAVTTLEQGELTVRRLVSDKELAVFLKYTNTLNFDEHDIDKIDPKDYTAWAMPESLAFNSRKVDINGIDTRH